MKWEVLLTAMREATGRMSGASRLGLLPAGAASGRISAPYVNLLPRPTKDFALFGSV